MTKNNVRFILLMIGMSITVASMGMNAISSHKTDICITNVIFENRTQDALECTSDINTDYIFVYISIAGVIFLTASSGYRLFLKK